MPQYIGDATLNRRSCGAMALSFFRRVWRWEHILLVQSQARINILRWPATGALVSLGQSLKERPSSFLQLERCTPRKLRDLRIEHVRLWWNGRRVYADVQKRWCIGFVGKFRISRVLR